MASFLVMKKTVTQSTVSNDLFQGNLLGYAKTGKQDIFIMTHNSPLPRQQLRCIFQTKLCSSTPLSGQKLCILFKQWPAKVDYKPYSRCLVGASRNAQFPETAKDRIEQLEAENAKLLARLAELESFLMEATAGKSLSEADANKISTRFLKYVAREDSNLVSAAVSTPTKLLDSKKIVWPSPNDKVPFWKQDFSKKMKQSNYDSADSQGQTYLDTDPLHVMHVTAEMAPIAKVGGLGDVVTGLARACLERGHKVEVMLPFYECIPEDQVTELSMSETYTSYHRGDWVPVKLYRGKVSGIPVLFVQPGNHFFKGSQIYGGSYDELEAYLFFSRACLEWMQVTGSQPDIIHVHEWQTSGLPLLYWDMYHNLSVKKPRIVLTIHNMEHYGECRVEQLSMCGLDGPAYCTNDKAVDDRTIGHNPERLSLLKGGIIYSNVVTTVSPTYANETLCSGWLASTLMTQRDKYTGVLNGIDTVLWDPAKDPYLPATFGARELGGKRICKQYVQRGLGLELSALQTSSSESKSLPLVICITRLVPQKGIHLIRYAVSRIEQLGGQFVMLGTAPDGRVQGEFEHIANQYKESKKVRLLLTYSEEMAHMLYAAADIVLVPSMFEPCGLTQMIGMRYGAIPLVRKTGGLADTVYDVDDQSNAEKANGFVFQGIDEGSFNSALERAFHYYFKSPDWWLELVFKVMQLDNSWNKSAGEYVTLYNSVRVRS